MHEIHDGSDFRLRDGYGISHTSVGQRLMFVFSWAHCGSIEGWFSLALTLGELRTFFCFLAVCYIFDCFSLVINWISKEASTRA